MSRECARTNSEKTSGVGRDPMLTALFMHCALCLVDPIDTSGSPRNGMNPATARRLNFALAKMRVAPSGIRAAFHWERSPFVPSAPEPQWFRLRLLSPLLQLGSLCLDLDRFTHKGICRIVCQVLIVPRVFDDKLETSVADLRQLSVVLLKNWPEFRRVFVVELHQFADNFLPLRLQIGSEQHGVSAKVLL